MDRAGFQIELEDSVAFAQREPKVAVAIEVDRARAEQRRAGNLRAVGRRAFFAGARKSADHPGRHHNFADSVVENVANEKVAAWIKLNAVRLVHRGLYGGASIAAESHFSDAGDGGNH